MGISWPLFKMGMNAHVDGKVTREELAAWSLQESQNTDPGSYFDAMDKDGDDLISRGPS